MASRKKQPQQTRLAILTAADAEFSAHGYSGAGIGAIVARAGITKGALFHHFPDKCSLAVAWIADVLEPALNAAWIDPLREIPSLDALRSFCRAKCLETTRGDLTACLVSFTTGDASADPKLAGALARLTSSWRSALAELLERGKTAGWIHPSIQPPAEAAFLVSAFCGLHTSCGGQDDDLILRACATSIEAYLETLRAA